MEMDRERIKGHAVATTGVRNGTGLGIRDGIIIGVNREIEKRQERD